jgi:hypothetical protein
MGGMALLSYLSSFGGRGVLPFGWDMLAVIAFSLAIYAYAIRVRLPAEQVREYVGDLTAEAEEEERELAPAAAD